MREMFKRNIRPRLFPEGNQFELSAYNRIRGDFKQYLLECSNSARRDYTRNDSGFRLWHIFGSEATISKRNSLFTFYELNELTREERNTLNNQDSILVSSFETKEVFESQGVKTPVIYAPLGFDEENVYQTGKTYYPPEITVFGIFGKWEKRKHHEKAIRAWLKRFGGRRDCILHTHIHNPHFSAEDNARILAGLFDGKPRPANVNTLPFMKTLSELNECYNAVNIVIDMSGAEGFSLPSFNCMALGKHGVIHNCSAMKDWAPQAGATLVEPRGEEEVYDGVFFNKGQPYNQGTIKTWNEDEFISACETAMAKSRKNPVNKDGELLQKEFTWSRTVNAILGTL